MTVFGPETKNIVNSRLRAKVPGSRQPNLEDYYNKLCTEAIGIVFDNKKLDRLPVGDERIKIAKILEARLLWFDDQLEKEILKRFGPFLRIRG